MSKKKGPPPDHLVPLSWLEKSGVTNEELAKWVADGIITKITIHGGAEFVCFTDHPKPVKFAEIEKLIAEARSKNA